MVRSGVIYTILMIFSLISPAANAGEFQTDTTIVRLPDRSFFETFRNDKEFDYGIEKPQKVRNSSFWRMILKFLNELNAVFVLMPLFLRILVLVIIVGAIYIIISKTKVYRFFYNSREVPIPDYSETEVFNEEVNFDAAINKAVELGNYRYAIRLLYIQILHQLRAKEMIIFSKEKTGKDYCNEISDEKMSNELAALTSVYYNVWYGEHNPAADHYQRLLPGFKNFYSGIYDR